MDQYQQYIHKSRYARYIPDLKRRETWEETVSRYVSFWSPLLNAEESKQINEAIVAMDVMPSMRCMMTAGEALDRDNVAGYNCAYLPIDSPRSFDELMYILLCGTGVGFSVEQANTNKLPEVPDELFNTETTIVVSDSKIGWASSFRELLSLLYAGKIPKCDLTRVRPAGARLRTFGGRASGPAPLADLFNYTVNVFKGAVGRKLTTLECHDLVCKIADIVVVGGVRRSALISLSDLGDTRLQSCKSGQWWGIHGQRALANNSAVYNEKPDFEAYFKEMLSLYTSKSGERGIFSRVAAKNIAERNGRRESNHPFGTNPCSEIILRPYQFCNLTEVVVRPTDTEETLMEKVRIATILGKLQSTLVNFRYLRKIWKNNTEEEGLLGVSLTGIMDNPLLYKNKDLPTLLEVLRDEAIRIDKVWSERLGIGISAAITCIKPSGTVSQLVNSSSGIHPRYSHHYIRTVRADKKDPLSTLMVEAGVPFEVDVTSPSNLVFSFPHKSPKGSVVTADLGAIEQLNLWKVYQAHWCEHKPSMTCFYKDSEFFDVCQWVWNNFDIISGVSFLPYDDHTYVQAPYQPVNKEVYESKVNEMPKDIDWDILEDDDNTEALQTLACTSGVCEL